MKGNDQTRRDRRSLEPPDEGSAVRRLLWAIVGAVVFIAARYVFGWG